MPHFLASLHTSILCIHIQPFQAHTHTRADNKQGTYTTLMLRIRQFMYNCAHDNREVNTFADGKFSSNADMSATMAVVHSMRKALTSTHTLRMETRETECIATARQSTNKITKNIYVYVYN